MPISPVPSVWCGSNRAVTEADACSVDYTPSSPPLSRFTTHEEKALSAERISEGEERLLLVATPLVYGNWWLFLSDKEQQHVFYE
jgi:hypothetical protein